MRGALAHPSVLVRASAFFILLQPQSEEVLARDRGDILRSVAEVLPNTSSEAVPAIENAVGVLERVYGEGSGQSGVLGALVSPALLEGIKAVLLHSNTHLVAHCFR